MGAIHLLANELLLAGRFSRGGGLDLVKQPMLNTLHLAGDQLFLRGRRGRGSRRRVRPRSNLRPPAIGAVHLPQGAR